ncbi:hypothetical protein ACFX10_024821 [Malus domestica]
MLTQSRGGREKRTRTEKKVGEIWEWGKMTEKVKQLLCYGRTGRFGAPAFSNSGTALPLKIPFPAPPRPVLSLPNLAPPRTRPESTIPAPTRGSCTRLPSPSVNPSQLMRTLILRRRS